MSRSISTKKISLRKFTIYMSGNQVLHTIIELGVMHYRERGLHKNGKEGGGRSPLPTLDISITLKSRSPLPTLDISITLKSQA